MKNLLAAVTLLISLAITAQEAPAYTGGLPYTIKTQTGVITLNLPKGTVISDNNRVIINGKTFTIERLDKQPYFEKLKEEQKKSDKPHVTEYGLLMQYTVFTSVDVKEFNQFDVEHPELTKDGHYIYRVTPKGNLLLIWYDNPKSGTITTSLNVCMVAGNSIINLSMEGPIDNASDDFKNTELLMREILDNTLKPQ